MIRRAFLEARSELYALGYRVMLNEGFHHPKFGKCFGNWHIIEDDGTKKILLKKGQSDKEALFALCHELGHAIYASDETMWDRRESVWHTIEETDQDHERDILYEIDANLRGYKFVPEPLRDEFILRSWDNLKTYLYDDESLVSVLRDHRFDQYASRWKKEWTHFIRLLHLSKAPEVGWEARQRHLKLKSAQSR